MKDHSTEIEKKKIESWRPHNLDLGMRSDYDKVVTYVESLGMVIAKRCPGSREKSLAFTKLEECKFWATAALLKTTSEE